MTSSKFKLTVTLKKLSVGKMPNFKCPYYCGRVQHAKIESDEVSQLVSRNDIIKI